MTAGDTGDVEVAGGRGHSTIRFAAAAGLSSLADPERTVVVADELTAGLVPGGFPRGRVALVPRGEAAKSLESLDALFGRFLELEVGRDWTVVGLGGGSVSDLAGFAASTWMRGLDFGFVPTTLLAMVDASVGGKNGLDFRGRKNLVGCFSQPRFVLIDPAMLAGLPEYDLGCGFVEAVKHGVLEGDGHLSALERAVARSGKIDRGALGPLVRRSVAFKAAIATEDERETGRRRTLNLGHTMGHGVEAVTGLAHGASVAAGLGAALALAVERGGSRTDADRVLALLARLGLPTGIEAARRASAETRDMSPAAFRDAVACAMASDKKRVGADVLFAMPMAIGDVRMEPVALDALQDFVRRAP